MFFLDEKGSIQEGTPLSDAEKETLDRMIEIFHASPDVCGGFHPSYNVKCLKLALEMRNRFDIAAKPDFEYVEVEDLPKKSQRKRRCSSLQRQHRSQSLPPSPLRYSRTTIYRSKPQ